MIKRLSLLIAVLAAFALAFTAAAESDAVTAFDVEQYSLDELREIKTIVDERLAVLEREWAIEHGDRTITFEETESTLFAKKTLKQQPVITRVVDDAPEKTTVVWTSSDDSVAKVSSDGTVTGVAKGDAEITATAKDNDAIFGSYTVHVVLSVTDVSAEEKDVTLLLSDDPAEAEGDLRVVIEPEDAFCLDVIWSSAKEEIVTVDENGRVKGLAPGKATVTAQSAEEGSSKKATFNITVVQAVSDITLSDAELTVGRGKTAKLKGEIAPENATDKKLTWTSSDEEIAKVGTDGTVTAKAVGECDITCEAADGSGVTAKCHITVIELVTSVKIADSNKLTALVGSTLDIPQYVSVVPEDATEQGVTYSIDSDEFATINAKGLLTANGKGTVTVTVTSAENTENPKSATAKVKLQQPVKTLTISESAFNVGNGSNHQLEFTVGPDKADDKKIIWSSANEEIATVSSSGSVKGVGTGTTTITGTANDGSGVTASVEVTVITAVKKISFDDKSVTLIDDDTTKLTARVTPEDATDTGVVWSSSDTSVAKVDSSGKVTAISKGSCVITATAHDGTGASADINVYVEPHLMLSVESIYWQTTWGQKNGKMGVTAESYCVNKTIKSFDYTVVCYNMYTSSSSTSYLSYEGPNIKPGNSGKSKLSKSGVSGFSNAYKVEITPTKVYFTDGTEVTIPSEYRYTSTFQF